VRSLAEAARFLAHAFAPLRCTGCDDAGDAPICARCLDALDRLALPPASRLPGGALIAAFEYRDPLRGIIHRVKYRSARSALGVVASFAAARLTQHHELAGDGIVAVPLGPRRLRQRGYNQAEAIAGPLATLTSMPVRAGLVRVRDTAAQAEIDAAARWRNVEDAFTWCGPPLSGLRLWLVDDVVTTGATVSAASAALLAAGAAEVGVVALAAVPSSSARTYDRFEWHRTSDSSPRLGGRGGAGDHRRAAPRTG